jgi:hypothetical protein
MNRFHSARLLARVNNRPEPSQSRGVPFSDISNVDMVARDRRKDPVVVTQRVSRTPFPGGKNVKGKQAWKYPGGNIIRAPSVSINGRLYTDPKEADAGTEDGIPRRKQESNFFITINPNQRYSEALEGAAHVRFENALKHLQNDQTLVRCIKFGPKDSHYADDIAHDVLLPGIDWKATVECGEKLGRMHCHIILYVQHYSQIQIDVKMMQYEFRMAFNEGLTLGDRMVLSDPPYIQVKMLPQGDWTTIMRQYIRKGMS